MEMLLTLSFKASLKSMQAVGSVSVDQSMQRFVKFAPRHNLVRGIRGYCCSTDTLPSTSRGLPSPWKLRRISSGEEPTRGGVDEKINSTPGVEDRAEAMTAENTATRLMVFILSLKMGRMSRSEFVVATFIGISLTQRLLVSG